jgi:hypothetical protein
MNRHEVLGRSLYESLETTQNLLQRQREKYEKRLSDPARPQHETRCDQLAWAVSQAALQHLGYSPIGDLGPILNEGVDRARLFFTTDWWKAHEEDRFFMEKQREIPVLGWESALQHGVLLADWTDRWNDAEIILDWVDDEVGRGISQDDPHLNSFLYSLSSTHRKLSVHEELLARIEKRGNRYERQLARVCDAISAGDAVGCRKEVPKAVKAFHKSEAEDVPNFLYWVSLDLSLLWTMAKRKGLPLPALSELEEATLVRTESVWDDKV